MMIVAGDYSLTIYEGTEQEVQPHFLVPHPEYNSTTNNSDIMLIKVQSATIFFLFFLFMKGYMVVFLIILGQSVHYAHYPLSLQLRAPISMNSYISVALLPRQDAAIAEGRMCRVSGWGYTAPNGGQIPSTIRTVKLPSVSSEKCNSSESFNGSITENMLCAGYSIGGKDACQVRGYPFFFFQFSLWTFTKLHSFILPHICEEQIE